MHISRNLQQIMNLRITRALTGKASIRTSPKLDVDVRQFDGSEHSNDNVSVEQVNDIDTQTEFVSDDRPFMENDEPWKNPAPQTGMTKRRRLIKQIKAKIALIQNALHDTDLPLPARLEMLKMGREYTTTERLQIIEDEERRRLDKFHEDACKRLGKRLIETNANLGNCDSYMEGHKRHIKKKIRFDWSEYSPMVYRYHVDSRPEAMPYGIKLYDLYQEPVVTTLSSACGHPVRARNEIVADQVTGLIYEIEIAATLGVPNRCYFADLLPRVPDSAPVLAFLVGYGENKRIYWYSLEEMPHFLGGGQTMGGKSNFMHVMICSFIARNSAEDVKLALVDLKFDGIELSRYEGIPHLVTDEIANVENGIACNPAQAIEVLKWAAAEGEKRGRMFKTEKIQNIKLWNRKHSKRHLPEVVIAIDELSLLRLDTEHGKDAYGLIQVISSTARASGIHLIAFTQSSQKSIVNELIKVNFPGRICFSVPDSSSSILFVNDGSAINLMPAGRAVFKHGTTKYMVQTPLIEPGEIDQIVRNAKAGKMSQKLERLHLEPEEIIEWAIAENNSSLSVRDVWNKFSTRMAKNEMERMLKDIEGQTFMVGDRSYQVLPGGAVNRPRIVVRVDNKGVAPATDDQDRAQDTEISTPEGTDEPE